MEMGGKRKRKRHCSGRPWLQLLRLSIRETGLVLPPSELLMWSGVLEASWSLFGAHQRLPICENEDV
ncbi:hypothetical protein COLO4_06959 [Corchorus olitorius]|uniref:Uncharacterized protein n=1 Tax=Corchorus olitorius TaxID=93759 RepID=A0A1R3KLE9_9ROSI|nr:hypothetical protein COLO4_06959 [Corchorus olitorius]